MSSWRIEGPEVGEVSEAAVIEAFLDSVPAPDGVWVANGDDAAVFAPPEDTGVVITKDDFVEEVHFTRALITPEALGARLVAVNVSDIAAMGARPRFFFLSIALPPDLPLGCARAIGAGIRRRCRADGVTILGGNVSRSLGPIFLSGTQTGEIEADRVVRRTPAPEVGDDIWMSGPPGRAAAGFRLASTHGPLGPEHPARWLYEAWAEPPSRVQFGRRIAAEGWARSMCDVSDGVGTDLPRLLWGRGAEIVAATLALDPEVEAVARAEGEDPIGFALTGGEDYELMMICPPAHRAAIAAAAAEMDVPALRLGRVSEAEGLALLVDGERRPLRRGYDHFEGGAS